MSKVWLITGSGSGLGRNITEAVLESGARLVATARDPRRLDVLVKKYGDQVRTASLDVADENAANSAVQAAVDAFGRLDVVVNNAGYGDIAPFEQLSSERFKAVIDTNFYGVVNVTRAALPIMRKQKSGCILQISSLGGRLAWPGSTPYHAAKWAVGGLTESLAQEVRAFGLKVTLVEPGAYATDFGKSSQVADVLEPYAEFRKQFLTHLADVERGDPEATAEAILKLVDAENPPLRLGLGTSILPRARAAYAERLETWEAWEDVSNAAMGEPKKSMAEWIEQWVQGTPDQS